MFHLAGQLPRHQYVLVDSAFTHKKPVGFVPAVWFGLVSFPGRAWGLTVMLESGAVYRNLPPHAIGWEKKPPGWTVEDSETWDVYGTAFSCIEYAYLAGLDVRVRLRSGQILPGQYLFSASPIGDGFSAVPEQSKEFSFIRLDNGRLTIQPTDRVLFRERSFTTNEKMEFPKDLRRQTEVWSCE